MAVEFPYRAEPAPGGQRIYRPVAKAILRGPGGQTIASLLYIFDRFDITFQQARHVVVFRPLD